MAKVTTYSLQVASTIAAIHIMAVFDLLSLSALAYANYSSVRASLLQIAMMLLVPQATLITTLLPLIPQLIIQYTEHTVTACTAAQLPYLTQHTRSTITIHI
jgi:hypothetical protein